MKVHTLFGCAVFGLLCMQVHADNPAGSDKVDTSKLVGDYQIIEGERGGEPLPENRVKDVLVRIAANAITTFDKDKKEVYAATYKINADKLPWRISMTATIAPVEGKGTKADGLIAMDGDMIKLIYALPGGKTPTEFKTQELQQMFVLKRMGKEKEGTSQPGR